MHDMLQMVRAAAKIEELRSHARHLACGGGSRAPLMAALRVAAGAMLVASVGINFANIIGRYFLSVSLSWAEEVMLFLMIGCVFLGAAPVGWMGRHIRMDVVVSLLPPRARARLRDFLRPGHHRDLRRARDLRLAGHDHARPSSTSAAIRPISRWSFRRPRCRSGFADGAAHRGAALSCTACATTTSLQAATRSRARWSRA